MGNHELKPLSAVPTGLTLLPYRFDMSNLSNGTFLESLHQWSTGAQGSVSICIPGFLWLIILVGHLPSFSLTISEHRDCHTATAVAASVWSSWCSMSALVQPLYYAFSNAPQKLPLTALQETPQIHLIELQNMIQKTVSFQTTNSKAWCWLVMAQVKHTLNFSILHL